jgi:RNA polymerase sigma-70 factor (ECF subfamily)
MNKLLTTQPDYARMDEAELVRHARAGESGAFRAIMQRGNQRLFRIARAVMRDDNEAEDVVQEVYLRAFSSLAGFRAEASIFTWLTRIVLNEASGRLRRTRRHVGLEQVEAVQNSGVAIITFPNSAPALGPEENAARLEVRRLLERAIDELPADFRLVFVMRDVEECSVAETAAALGIREETVKTRLHRARRLLRGVLSDRLASTVSEAFPFLGERCERISNKVLGRLVGQSMSQAQKR